MLRIILDETVLERNNCNLSEKVYIRSKINLLKVDQVDFKNCVFIDCNFVSEPRNFVPGPIINCAFYDCRRNGEYFPLAVLVITFLDVILVGNPRRSLITPRWQRRMTTYFRS